MAENENQHKKHTWLGIIFLTIGILWILRNMDIMPYFVEDLIFNWPNILIILGGYLIIVKGKRDPGIILLIIGSVFFIRELGFFHFRDVITFWPLVFILVGASFLFRRNKSTSGHEVPQGEGPDYIDDISFFSGGERKITSQSFKGGKITSVFGGSEINLTRADIQGNNNVIDVFVMFGGCEITVPADWNVKVETTAIFGAFDDKRSTVVEVIPDDEKVLIIKGFIMFGGGEVKSY